MPKRSPATIEQIAAWDNLVLATYRAAKGKRTRPVVARFLNDLVPNLRSLQSGLLSGSLDLGHGSRFEIFDPKRRTIHAPAFRERVLHHAIIRHVGPVLEKSLVADTFACRIGKGSLAAVRRAQQHSRRFTWFGKLDVRKYFASIDHGILMGLSRRKFKNPRLLDLFEQILNASPVRPGLGLPIGALTSQNFANFYLAGFDRFLQEKMPARGMVRYMDDVAWWCDTKEQATSVAAEAEEFLRSKLSLRIRQPMQVNRSVHGISFCGYRIYPGVIRLLRRRRRRYAEARKRWETRFHLGLINESALQAAYSSVLSMTLHADATEWRRRELLLRPPVEEYRDV